MKCAYLEYCTRSNTESCKTCKNNQDKVDHYQPREINFIPNVEFPKVQF